MRPVTASHQLRKSYNKALDEGNDPFRSVYGANFGRDEIKQRIADAFDGTTIDPVWPHPADPKNRQVRLLELKLLPDQVELKIRNSPRKKKEKKETEDKK